VSDVARPELGGSLRLLSGQRLTTPTRNTDEPEKKMSDTMPTDFRDHYGVALDDAGSMDFHDTLEAAEVASRIDEGDVLPIYRVSYTRLN
jgi:hypothetical protein